MLTDVLRHYEALIDENHDPARDPAPLQAYMNGWDGRVFLDALKLDGTQHVLEIGVGTGRLALRIAPRCRAFTGIDLSPKTIRRAGENLAALPHVTLLCGDFLTAELAAGFDVICSSLTFLHIVHKAQAVGKIACLLAPGGRTVLSLDKCRDAILDYGSRQLRVYPDDPAHIEALMRDAGLTLLPRQETAFAYILTAVKEV